MSWFAIQQLTGEAWSKGKYFCLTGSHMGPTISKGNEVKDKIHFKLGQNLVSECQLVLIIQEGLFKLINNLENISELPLSAPV